MLKYLVDPLRPPLEWPTHLKLTCDFGRATALSLSRHRGYLALGTGDGGLLVLDIETLSPQFRFRGHAGAITTISWSDDARYIITAGDDWCFCVWDMLAKRLIRTIQLSLSPRLVEFNFEKFNEVIITCGPDLYAAMIPLDEESPFNLRKINQPTGEQATQRLELCLAKFVSGGRVVIGNNRGQIVCCTTDGQAGPLIRVSQGTFRAGCFNKSTQLLAVAGADRSVRLIDVMPAPSLELELGHRFTDIGLQCQWNSISFSENGEFLYAAGDVGGGTVCLWNVFTHMIVRQLGGASETLSSIDFDSDRVCLYGIGKNSGRLFVWRAPHPDTWGGLIPDFEQIEDLEEFRESEDAWDMPREIPLDLAKQINVWDPEEPVMEVVIPVDI